MLNNAVAADLKNKGRPRDDSIALKNRGILEKYVEPVIAALRACGAPPDTADQGPAPRISQRVPYEQSVKDLIDAGLLKTGTKLRPIPKHYSEAAEVLSDGRLKVGDTVYSALSSAAVAVSGSKSQPGWSFWGAPSGNGDYVPLHRLRDRLIEVRIDATAQLVSADAAVDDADVPRLSTKRKRYKVSVRDLLKASALTPGETLYTTRRGIGATATVGADGSIEVAGQPYGSLSTAAVAASGNSSEPGWEFWAVERGGKRLPVHVLRAQHLAGSDK